MLLLQNAVTYIIFLKGIGIYTEKIYTASYKTCHIVDMGVYGLQLE